MVKIVFEATISSKFNMRNMTGNKRKLSSLPWEGNIDQVQENSRKQCLVWDVN